MKAWQANKHRQGMSLLEMMVATAIMATLMTSIVVVVRTGHAAWRASAEDVDALENAYAVLRHFVRQMRQAEAVTAITAAGNTAGSLSFRTAHDPPQVHTLSRNGGNSNVNYGDGSTTNLLARAINQLTFVGYEADGVTTTTVVDDIQMVRCRVGVTLTQGGGTTRDASVIAWIRSWQ